MYTHNKLILSEKVYTGAYLDACTGYSIRDNVFRGGRAAMEVHASGGASNKIEKNTFIDVDDGFDDFGNPVSVGIMVHGNNRNGTSTGLYLRCNTYNNYHHAMGLWNGGSMKMVQGGIDPDDIGEAQATDLALNRFFARPDIVNSDFWFGTGTAMDYNYLQPGNVEYNSYWLRDPGHSIASFPVGGDGFAYNDESLTTIDRSGVINEIWEQGCPSGPGGLPSADDLITRLGTTKSLYITANGSYTQSVDGGNTLYTLNRIESIQPNNKNEIVDELNSYDRLSEVSVNTFLDKDINGLVIKRKNLLMKNSPLPGSSQPLLAAYDLPNPHKQDLLDAQDGPSLVEQDFNELATLETDYQEAQGDIIRYALSEDTTGTLIDTVIFMLEADTNLYTRLQLIPLYLGQGMLTEATATISLAEIQKNYLWSQEERTNVENQLTLLQLSVDMLQPGADRDAIITANSPELFAMVADTSTRENVRALLLLKSIGLSDYEPQVVLPYIQNSAKSLEITSEINPTDPTTEFLTEPVFAVYPNPNDGSMWLQYAIKEKGSVIIYNSTGIQEKKYILDPQSKYVLLKNPDLKAGVYMYRVFENETVVHTGKVTIIRQ
ncbi:MAG: T9SS type A sorting domain-containing protein [Bacteroidota bacterium]